MSPLDPKKALPNPRPARAPVTQEMDVASSWPSLPEIGSNGFAAGPPSMAGLHLPSAPGMNSVVGALRRRWPLLVGLGVGGAGLVAAAVWFLVPPQFTSQSLLEMGRPLQGEFELLNFKRTQASLVKSGPVLQAVLQDPEVAALPLVRAQEDPFAWLDTNLMTDELLGPGILRVTLSGERPQDLPVVLNAVVRSYLDEFRRNEQAKVETWRKKLQKDYGEARDKIRRQRGEYNERTSRLGIENPETLVSKRESARLKLTQVQAPLLLREQELIRAKVEYKNLRQFVGHPEKIAISADALEQEYRKEKSILAIEEAIGKIDLEILAYKEVAQPETVDLRTLEDKRASAEKSLAALKQNLKPGLVKRLQGREHQGVTLRLEQLERQITYLEEQRDSLLQQQRKLEAEIDRVSVALNSPDKVLNASLLELQRDIEQTESTAKQLNQGLGSLSVGANIPQIAVREKAQVPLRMDLKRQIKLAGAAGLGVFGLVFMGVFWGEYRNRRVYAADDVVQGLGINLVGTLPALPALSRRPLQIANRPRDRYWQNLMTESVDVIRTVLLHAAQSSGLRVVMVTSAGSGEGKTSVASHLAASLARSWRKTLLIDCDLRNPAAHQQFELALEPGLSEVLRGEVELEDVIRSTPVSRLWLVPAGKWDSHAIQALAQQEVHALFERLKEQFDFIVIDSCPVLPVADSLLIGQHADAALFSILRDVSRVPAVHAAYQRMSSLDIRMLGAVVVGEKVGSYGQNYQYLSQPAGE